HIKSAPIVVRDLHAYVSRGTHREIGSRLVDQRHHRKLETVTSCFQNLAARGNKVIRYHDDRHVSQIFKVGLCGRSESSAAQRGIHRDESANLYAVSSTYLNGSLSFFSGRAKM